MNRARVLHITSHLGGGVGCVLSALASHNGTGRDVEDVFICLEKPQDVRYAENIAASGAKLFIEPSEAEIHREIVAADIVQVEWWHHPLIAKMLCRFGSVPARWVVWAHTSGLYYPAIRSGFVKLPQAFIATTPATLPLLEGANAVLECIPSTGGFDDFPVHEKKREQPVRCGYLGSLNPAKLHPDIVQYVRGVDRPDFKVDFFGDSSVNPMLEAVVGQLGKNSPIRLCGFSQKPQDVLPMFNIFVYLLNPLHYGTTENALLEAMACGAVPVVINNPVEKGIVQNKVTGMVVDGPETFADAVRFLLDHPDDLRKMSEACALAVRKNYSVGASAKKLGAVYKKVLSRKKQSVDFTAAFGKTPSDWFLSCLGDYAGCFAEGTEKSKRAERLKLPFLYEKTKASVFQFHSCFPEETRLAKWAAVLRDDLS